jgi:hypothetical protein
MRATAVAIAADQAVALMVAAAAEWVAAAEVVVGMLAANTC